MGIVPGNMKPGSLRGRTARLAALDRGEGVAPPADADPDYDPSAYTVDEVVHYARAHPEASAAILKSERAKSGKQRKGVLDALS